MAMMDIRIVGVTMCQRVVSMPMGVWLSRYVVVRPVCMPMMFVMNMWMRMLRRQMRVQMFVFLR